MELYHVVPCAHRSRGSYHEGVVRIDIMLSAEAQPVKLFQMGGATHLQSKHICLVDGSSLISVHVVME